MCQKKPSLLFFATAFILTCTNVLASSAPELRERALAGDISAQYELAKNLTNRPKAFQKLEEARSWHESAASAGHPKAKTALAVFLLEGWGGQKDEERALQLLQENSAASEPVALLNLGNLYERGRVVEPNPAQAETLYLQAAKLGLPEAHARVGELYYHGTDEVPPDYAKALTHFQAAAEQNVATAQNYLGLMYEFGLGVETDRVQAKFWYEKAAWQDLARAQGNLGNLLRFGPPEEQDLAQAYRWFWFGAEKRDPNSMMGLAVLKEAFSIEEKREAEAGIWEMQNQLQAEKDKRQSAALLESPEPSP